jgi:hypothetical protein
MFTETSGLSRATLCNTPEENRHCHRRENIPQGSILRIYKLNYGVIHPEDGSDMCSPKRQV